MLIRPTINSLPSTRVLARRTPPPMLTRSPISTRSSRARLVVADGRLDADPGTERCQEQAHDRGALEPFEMGQCEQPLHHPPPEVIGSPERIASRLRAADDQPFGADRERDRGQVDHHVDADDRGDFLEQRGIAARQQHVADEDAQPLRGRQGQDERQDGGLRQPAQKPTPQRWRREAQVLDDPRATCADATVDKGRDGAQAARPIHVLQSDSGQRRGFANH